LQGVGKTDGTVTASYVKVKQEAGAPSFAVNLKDNYLKESSQTRLSSLPTYQSNTNRAGLGILPITSSGKLLTMVENMEGCVDSAVIGTSKKTRLMDMGAEKLKDGQPAKGCELGVSKSSISRARSIMTKRLKEVKNGTAKKSEKKAVEVSQPIGAVARLTAPELICKNISIPGGDQEDRATHEFSSATKSARNESHEVRESAFRPLPGKGSISSLGSIALFEIQKENHPNAKNDVGRIDKPEAPGDEGDTVTTRLEARDDVAEMVFHSVEGVTHSCHVETPSDNGIFTQDRVTVDQDDTGLEYWGGREHGNELDAITDSGPVLLGANSKTIEVGVVSGMHGWLKIRAEIEHGVVTASVATKSTAMQERLHHELPLLNTFLQGEKVGGEIVEIKHLTSTGAESTNPGGGAHSRERYMGQQSDRRNGERPPGDGDSLRESGEQPETFNVWQGIGGHIAIVPAMSSRMGSWLNIRV
jgi:hypothetical protein